MITIWTLYLGSHSLYTKLINEHYSNINSAYFSYALYYRRTFKNIKTNANYPNLEIEHLNLINKHSTNIADLNIDNPLEHNLERDHQDSDFSRIRHTLQKTPKAPKQN